MHADDAAIQEDGFHYLRPHAHEYVAELIAAFHAERDPDLRLWLFELLGEARSPDLLPLFATALRGEDWALWERALRALKKLDTKEARRLIFEARTYTFPTEEQTCLFRAAYDRIVER